MSFVIKLLVIIVLSSGFPIVLPATCGKQQIEQQQIVEFVSNVIHVIYMIRRVFVVRNYFKFSSVRKLKILIYII